MNEIRKTKDIIENANKILQQHNNEYYREILNFLNILFSSEAKSITSIYFNKIAISADIFDMYNKLIDKYSLDAKHFNIELFFQNDPITNSKLYSKNDIISICQNISNNLLKRINYKADIIYIEGKPIIKFKYTS